jgi:hypothetical protein
MRLRKKLSEPLDSELLCDMIADVALIHGLDVEFQSIDRGFGMMRSAREGVARLKGGFLRAMDIRFLYGDSHDYVAVTGFDGLVFAGFATKAYVEDFIKGLDGMILGYRAAEMR